MKILYIGNYKDQTGWSQAGIDYILALDKVGVEVVPRHIKLNGLQGTVPLRIHELEQNSTQNCDVVIQNVLPHLMQYDGNFDVNIGLYFSETSHFRSSNWPTYLNMMDRNFVSCKQAQRAAWDSNVTTPTFVIPCPTDTAKYRRSYKPLNLREEVGDAFIFYTIGEFTRRKNYLSLLKAFHSEFDPDEPVELLIKTTPTHTYVEEQLRAMCDDVKSGLRLYRDNNAYKREIIVCSHWSEENIMRLHSTANCFVSTSYGEGWSIPAFDAMAFGKTPIVTNCTAFQDYIEKDNGPAGGWLVDCVEEPVFNVADTFPGLFTAGENWWQIDLLHLRKCLREAYENTKMRKEKALVGMERADEYSYEKIGQLMKERILCA